MAAEREKRGVQGEVALVRVEQLAPFPFDLVMREMRRYPQASVMWCGGPRSLGLVLREARFIGVSGYGEGTGGGLRLAACRHWSQCPADPNPGAASQTRTLSLGR